ncbi:MAG TPA: endonuclease/exonuclease/phosphatase family protein [Propionibacteriaceae bacterium]|nr:endonuclease/exonuclease/phosphatase family protein [Propionibacteriaceae bacterium]
MRAQRVAAATAVIGLVSVCCAVGITAGSASTSDPATVKAAPGPNVSETTTTSEQNGSNTLGDKVKTDRASSSKTRHARSSRLRAREVFSVGEKRNSLTLRVGTFNVRTARAHDDRSWLERANDVAREISSRNPGVLAVQELGPGRADGSKGTTTGHLRQTVSLERSLQRVIGDDRYQLVRTTPYVRPGTDHGTQGTRILYDTRKFKLLSSCPEKTGSKNYNPSCSMNLPLRSSDSESLRRSAAYAKFANRKTGVRFWVVSVHLDDRHSSSLSTEKSYNALRGAQARAVYLKVNGLRKSGEKIIYAGDFNSWQTNRAGDAPREYLLRQGFSDTAAAATRININYPTINHFNTTVTAKRIRLDMVMIKGSKRVLRYENVMKRVDSSRPSDHNLVVSDVVL